MAFKTFVISNPGGRAANEDCAGYLESERAGCWVVADGLGGHAGGATASHVAVDAALDSFRANPQITHEALESHLRAADAAIRERQCDPALSNMRSTIVMLLAGEREAISGHLGDSRLYQFQAGRVAYQTRDHSVPGALAASGAIGAGDIRFHEDRSRLLRSLGNDSPLKPAIETRTLCQGDTFLLCTDGFWEYISEIEMEVDYAKAQGPADWLRFMSARLLTRAKPDHDNYTAVGVCFQSPNAPDPPMPGALRRKPGAKVGKDSVLFGIVGVLLMILVLSLAVVRWPDRALAACRTARGLVTHSAASKPGAPSPSRKDETSEIVR